MELYVNGADRNVYLEVPPDIAPVDGTFTIHVRKGATNVAEIDTVAYNPRLGRFDAVFPFHLMQEDGEYEIDWRFSYVEGGTTRAFAHSSHASVVTPYVSLSDIAEMVADEDDFTAADIKRIERNVRHIINAHTGQPFGKHTRTYEINGNGKTAIQLPERLIAVNTFNGVANAFNFFNVEGDGWWLTFKRRDVPPVRADYHELHRHRGGVIHNPNLVSLDKFYADTVYTIDGQWGYKSVPYEVQEAARLLINDYATGETVYRDRYLTSMTAADWRIQFHAGAFNKTGNVRADQLLSDYVLQRGWAVL